MDIIVNKPTEIDFAPATSLEEAFSSAMTYRPLIRELTQLAFEERDRNAWEKVQSLLYLWNTEELLRTAPVTDYSRTARQILRNEAIAVQLESAPRPHLHCANSFTPEKAINELHERAMTHRVRNHPLMELMRANGLSIEHAKLFLSNYYVNNRFFHLHIAAQSLSVPLEIRGELAKNLYDEMGAGDISGAHPLLFLKSFDTIGRPTAVIPLPESLYLLNTKILYTYLIGSPYYGVGGLGFIELAMPDQMRAMLEGLRKSGIPEKDLIFFDLHITVDEVHGEAWFDEMGEIIKTVEQAQQALEGGLALLDGRAVFYDGVLSAIEQTVSAAA